MTAPLITGASVSAGLDGVSFGEQLAKKYHSQQKVRFETYPGTKGESIIEYPTFSAHVQRASVVIALDFFYWDQLACDDPEWKSNTENPFEKNIDKAITALFQESAAKGIPLVIGNLSPAQGPFENIKYEADCAAIINQKVKENCDQYPDKCLIIDVSDMAKFISDHFAPRLKLIADQANKDKYAREYITRDGIHPRTDAYGIIGKYLERMMKDSLLQSTP